MRSERGLGLLLLAVLTAGVGDRVDAQVAVHASLGARYTSTLVHDSVVAPVDVRPAIGPALAISVSELGRGLWTPDLTLDVTWAALRRHEGGTSERFNSLTTVVVTVGIRRRMAAGLGLRVGIGGLKHLAGDRTGMFRDGAGIAPVGTLALDWMPVATAPRELGVFLRYDAHRFNTPALQREGFADSRFVHRIALGARVRLAGAR